MTALHSLWQEAVLGGRDALIHFYSTEGTCQKNTSSVISNWIPHILKMTFSCKPLFLHSKCSFQTFKICLAPLSTWRVSSVAILYFCCRLLTKAIHLDCPFPYVPCKETLAVCKRHSVCVWIALIITRLAHDNHLESTQIFSAIVYPTLW